MSVLKMADVTKMSKKDRDEKLRELKLELIKSSTNASKTKIKTKEIKKAIARLFTFAQTEKKREVRTK